MISRSKINIFNDKFVWLHVFVANNEHNIFQEIICIEQKVSALPISDAFISV